MSENHAQLERRQYLRRQSDQTQDEISLIDLYLVLVCRKKVILFAFTVIVALSIIYLMVAPKIYQVSAMLL